MGRSGPVFHRHVDERREIPAKFTGLYPFRSTAQSPYGAFGVNGPAMRSGRNGVGAPAVGTGDGAWGRAQIRMISVRDFANAL